MSAVALLFALSFSLLASPLTERVGVCQPIAEDDIAISAQASQGRFSISAADPACMGVIDHVWTPISDSSWLTVSGATLAGNSIVISYAVLRNRGKARIGTITIAGFTYTVRQGKR